MTAKMIVVIVIICLVSAALVTVGAVWGSGYLEARKLVKKGQASIVVISLRIRNMNALRCRGFVFYLERHTDFDMSTYNPKDWEKF